MHAGSNPVTRSKIRLAVMNRYRLHLVLLFLLLSAPCFGSVSLNPSMTTAQIQSALNSAAQGDTVSFAVGAYTLTGSLYLPCRGLILTGPKSTPPTAVLTAQFTNNPIFQYNSTGGCQALGSIEYLAFHGTGAVYVGGGSNHSFTFEHNSVGGLPSKLSNITSESGLYFDGDMTTTLSNIMIASNLFGDDSSCTAAFKDASDDGGYCSGVIVHQGVTNGLTIEGNVFDHLEEGIHIEQLVNFTSGATESVCIGCRLTGNYIEHYQRIGIEVQVGTPSDAVDIEDNVVADPLDSSYNTFAVSAACCNDGYVMGTIGFSPGLIFTDNVLISTGPCGPECPPFGVEFWGTGSHGTNSLVEGNFSNGYTWGYGSGDWTISGNYICGPNFLTKGGYISNEEGQTNAPTTSGNTTAATCAAIPSVAPSISPAGGSFTGSVAVTISEASKNTAAWYTTDGSDPVPGSGTARIYSGPISVTRTTTVRAVGMWGNSIQPTGYPAGYGYSPSPAVTEKYTSVPPAPSLLKGVIGNVQ